LNDDNDVKKRSKMARGLFKAALILILLFPACVSAQAITLCEKAKAQPIYQGSDGVLFGETSFLKGAPQEWKTVPLWLDRLNDAFAYSGVTLVMLPLPTRGEVQGESLSEEDLRALGKSWSIERGRASYTAFVSTLRGLNVTVADVLTPAIALVKSGTNFYLKYDAHWGPDGARVAAQAVAAAVKELESYKQLPKKEFTTRLLKVITKEEAFVNILKDLCQISIPLEPINQYITEEKNVSLFSEVKPEIALMGDSYSGVAYNLGGFLSEYLSLDVYNNFVGGGALFTSIEDYVTSPEYQENKPTYLVWQFLIGRVFDMERGGGKDKIVEMRQLIPAVLGACSLEDSLASNNLDLSAQNVVVFQDLKNLNIKDRTHYLYLELDDPTLVAFTLTLHYGENAEKVNIERSTRRENRGKFFLEFRENAAQPLTSIEVGFPTQPTGSLQARVCKSPLTSN
jgi:alginate biosynthesis protein AlgX